MNITPNATYSMSALVKGNGGNATGNWAVRLHYYDSARNILPSTYTDIGASTSSTTTTTGQSVGGTFTAPANAASMKISLSSTLTGGTLKIENISILQAANATKYYFAGAQRIAMRANGTLSYLIGDHLGSTSLVAKDTITGVRANDVIAETRYKPWGEVRYTTPNQTLPTRYTYTGQYSYMNDDATDLGSAGFGLMFYNARWYDPYITQFTQPDTVVPDPTHPQSWDRYSYTSNNPIKYVDPSGHADTPWYMMLAAALFVVDQSLSYSKGQGIDNAKWEAAADVFLPPQSPGTQISGQATFIGPLVGAFGEINLVSHYEGEVELFASHSTLPAIGFPQVGFSVSSGPIYGNNFAINGTEAFGGNSLQGFGGISLGLGGGVDAWGGFDDKGNPLTWDGSGHPSGVGGYDTGITLGLSSPLSAGGGMLNAKPLSSIFPDNVAKAVDQYTHFQLKGPWLFGCRAVGMCGR